MSQFVSYLLSIMLSFGTGSPPSGVAAGRPILVTAETPPPPPPPPPGPKPPKERITPKPEEVTWGQLKARYRR